jgi:transcriptional regulator with PAS, ATPase and Fis domain
VSSGIIGTSESMVSLRRYIGKVAQTDANVLITGETGTGKEQVAEAIHRQSPRNLRPFACINCAAIPENLLESELFGYEKGAFTGAQTSYPGKMRLAHGGTLFLDEIGDMSTYVQAKILRVLESREVFPLGARKAIGIDVRIISATNQDLALLLEQKKFRKDLYYRLNVARIDLPPLKERKEDILPLFQHFFKDFSHRYQVSPPGPGHELINCLQEHDWPGNIRELRNLVEALFIDLPAGPIGIKDLPETFRSIFAQYVSTGKSEREKLLAALEATKWNKSRAAAQLKLSRMTLYRKLAKYQLNTDR